MVPAITDFDKQAVKNLVRQIQHVMKYIPEQELRDMVLANLRQKEVETFCQFLSLFDE